MKKIFNAATCCLFLLAVPSVCAAAASLWVSRPIGPGTHYGRLIANLERSRCDRLITDLRSYNPRTRLDAEKSLKLAVEAGNEVAINALVEALRSNYASIVHCAAAKSLKPAVEAGSEMVINALVEALSEDRDSIVRKSAAKSLKPAVEAENEVAINALVEALNDDRASIVRCAAAESLKPAVEAGSEMVINALVEVLREDRAEDHASIVHCAAAESLQPAAKVGNEKAINAFSDYLFHHPDESYYDIISILEFNSVDFSPSFYGSMYDILFLRSDFKQNEKEELVVEGFGFDSLEDMRKTAARKGLRKVRKKHPLSRLALGLGIKPGSIRDRKIKECSDGRCKKVQTRRNDLSPLKKRARRAGGAGAGAGARAS